MAGLGEQRRQGIVVQRRDRQPRRISQLLQRAARCHAGNAVVGKGVQQFSRITPARCRIADDQVSNAIAQKQQRHRLTESGQCQCHIEQFGQAVVLMVLVGPQPSVLRAAVMGGISVFALLIGRSRSGLPGSAGASVLCLRDRTVAFAV